MRHNSTLIKRIFCALLTALMLVSAVSCSSGADSEKTADTSAASGETAASGEDTTAAETEPEDMFEARANVKDNLPEKDYGGADFNILTESYAYGTLTVEELTGDIVDDAIYNRNADIGERFNIKIKVTDGGDYDPVKKLITSSVNAGDDTFALTSTHVVSTGALALEGMFNNWYDIPYVDFSNPWWSKSTTDDLSYNGKCPLAIGDFVFTALADTYCIFYNKTLAENYSIPNAYETVNEGKWTFDYITGITKDIYVDLDGDGAQSYDDFYGYATDARSNVNTYLWSFGNNIISKNNAGELEVTYHTEKMGQCINTLVDTFKNNAGMSAVDEWGWNVGRDLFMESRDIFGNGQLGNTALFRDLEDDYGILPYPKWDEAQENYYTMVDGAHSILGVPVTVGDTERTGIITEALNAESYKTVVPSFYQTTLKEKYARDAESIEMIDLVVNSRVFDMGYVYDGWKGSSFFFQNMISKGNTNFESFWASKESSVNTWYGEVIAYFSED